jgi:septal ring factor EnvC (AmiA/AmiB activator)
VTLLLTSEKSLANNSSPSKAVPIRKLEGLTKDYEETKKSIIEKEERQRQIMSALFQINKKMKKIVTEQTVLNDEKMVLEASTKTIADRILSLEEKMKKQKIDLREKLSAIYKLGGQGVARVIFSSINSADLERNLKILGIIAEKDLASIKEYSATRAELTIKKEKFVHRLKKLKEVSNKIAAQESKLSDENRLKKKILDNLKRSQEFSISKLTDLRDKTMEFGYDDSGLLDLLMRPSFFEKKGHLPSPIKGRVSKNFGIVRDQEHNISWAQKGLVFSAKENSPIKSVFDGTIAFVGKIPGFGHTVIVDHGDHYYTVYGSARALEVSEGEEIKQGQIIAWSGTLEDEKTEGLYFEIRHFSEPFDPAPWLKGTPL